MLLTTPLNVFIKGYADYELLKEICSKYDIELTISDISAAEIAKMCPLGVYYSNYCQYYNGINTETFLKVYNDSINLWATPSQVSHKKEEYGHKITYCETLGEFNSYLKKLKEFPEAKPVTKRFDVEIHTVAVFKASVFAENDEHAKKQVLKMWGDYTSQDLLITHSDQEVFVKQSEE